MDISSVLCVCTGNICRSPLAERLLAAAVPGTRVESAGIGALEGAPMEPTAAAIAAREGFTAEDHRARQLTRAMVRDFDLVLAMDTGHKDWIERRYPGSRGRVFLASHWQEGDDIEDPYGLSAHMFERVYTELVSCMDDWGHRLSV